MGGAGQRGRNLRTCLYCTRDTSSRSGICSHCAASPPPPVTDESVDDFPEHPSDHDYHGDSDRDDL